MCIRVAVCGAACRARTPWCDVVRSVALRCHSLSCDAEALRFGQPYVVARCGAARLGRSCTTACPHLPRIRHDSNGASARGRAQLDRNTLVALSQLVTRAFTNHGGTPLRKSCVAILAGARYQPSRSARLAGTPEWHAGWRDWSTLFVGTTGRRDCPGSWPTRLVGARGRRGCRHDWSARLTGTPVMHS